MELVTYLNRDFCILEQLLGNHYDSCIEIQMYLCILSFRAPFESIPVSPFCCSSFNMTTLLSFFFVLFLIQCQLWLPAQVSVHLCVCVCVLCMCVIERQGYLWFCEIKERHVKWHFAIGSISRPKLAQTGLVCDTVCMCDTNAEANLKKGSSWQGISIKKKLFYSCFVAGFFFPSYISIPAKTCNLWSSATLLDTFAMLCTHWLQPYVHLHNPVLRKSCIKMDAFQFVKLFYKCQKNISMSKYQWESPCGDPYRGKSTNKVQYVNIAFLHKYDLLTN